jgi:DNA replication licensing factor MCM4
MQVKTFNLQESKVIRDLNPADINCLISVSGMVTRTSAVIPDLTCAAAMPAACMLLHTA